MPDRSRLETLGLPLASAGVLQSCRSFLAGFASESDFFSDKFPLKQRQTLDPLSLTSSRWLAFRGTSAPGGGERSASVSERLARLGLPVSKACVLRSRTVSRDRAVLRLVPGAGRPRAPPAPPAATTTKAAAVARESPFADSRERVSVALRKKQVEMKFQSAIGHVLQERTTGLPRLAAVGTAIRKRREASESLRMLVFGRTGNELLGRADKKKIFEERRGTREEMRQLHKLWLQLDTDNSGEVDGKEFAGFFNRNKEQRLLGWKAQQFLGREGGRARLEDFMQLLYLEATETDLAEMKVVFEEEALFLKAVKEPPVLPGKMKKELVENFKHLDKSRRGVVTFEALVKGNILTVQEADELMAKYDTNNDGNIDQQEFLEMACPHGYRASEDAVFATDSSGAPIMKVHGTRFQGWIETDR